MMTRRSFLALIVAFVVFAGIATGNAIEKKQGVYEYVVRNVPGEFTAVVQQLDSAFRAAGYQVLGTLENAAPEGCSYHVTVLAVYNPAFGKQLLSRNPQTAPYALVDRIIVFQDEEGTHISIVNPINILRTVLMDDEGPVAMADAHRQELRKIIEGAITGGKRTTRQYGQFRKKGYIGRTMGVMAGGPFNEKINTITATSASLEEAVNAVKQAFANNSGKWKLRVRYVLTLPNEGIAVVGVSSPSVESRSFKIVGAGSDDSREDFKCPGIAHAGAYPMEVVLRAANGKTTAEVTDIMYRMKMYFEDAGKWAFAKNMTMPGSIQSEIEDVVKAALTQ